MALKKYSKVRRPGHSKTHGLFDMDEQELIITEKLDGNNARVQRDGDALRFGSRNVDLGTDLDEIGGMFDQVTDYLDETVDTDDLADLEGLWEMTHEPCENATITLFGENAVQHQISEYEWEAMPQFNLFDVHVACDSDVDGDWLRWGLLEEDKEHQREAFETFDADLLEFFTVEDVADFLGLETAPLVEWTTVGEFLDENDIDEWDVPKSVYRDDDGQAEGVVFRNPATGVKAKRISDDFAERKAEMHGSNGGGGGDGDGPSDHEQFLTQHATNNRIEKNIGKVIEAPDNDHDSVEMKMMSILHLKVWRDIWAEDYEEIISEKWTLDLDNLHNEVANKCAARLQKLLRSGEVPVSVVEPTTGTVEDELLGELND